MTASRGGFHIHALISVVAWFVKAFMRSLSSFLLSLLMLAAIVGVQVAVIWPAGVHDVVAMVYMQDVEPHEYGVDILQEFEEDVEDETVEYSIHRPHRTSEVNPAQDDRNELFGPPEDIAVGIAHVWMQPQAHAVHPNSACLDGMLRPPSDCLPLAGEFQRA